MNPLALASITAASQMLANNQKNQALQRLGQLGLRLHFPHLPPGWIPAVHPADLTPAWLAAGLAVSGVGYSTIGALSEDRRTSRRFWPTSPYYQAWLGGYLLQTPPGYGLIDEQHPNPAELMQVALADQAAWLKNYGHPRPQARLRQGSWQVVQDCQHQDYPAWLVQGVIDSQSDVGKGNRTRNGYLSYRTYELMFERFGGLRLPALCTLPPVWPLASYHPLELSCLGLFVRIGGHGHWALLYCCAARWYGRDGLPELGPPALESLRQVRIVSA